MFYINIFQGTLMSGSITYQSFGEINYIEQHKNLEHEHLLCGLNLMFFHVQFSYKRIICGLFYVSFK